MQAANTVGGGHLVFMDMQIGHSAAAGVPLTAAATNGDGLEAVESATACTEYVGISTQAVTHATTHQSDNSDPQASMQVGVNPDMILRVRLSGSTTAGTAMTPLVATTASPDGLDNGGVGTASFTIWGYNGANVGYYRVQSAADTPSVSWPYLNAVGDEWLEASLSIAEGAAGITLTTDFTECSATSAFNTTENFNAIRLEGRSKSKNGINNSFVQVVPGDSYWGTL